MNRTIISNWENSKSYPDLQSLLLLSDYFKVSLDELVKGDVVDIKSELERKQMKKMSYATTILFVLALISLTMTKVFGIMPFLILQSIAIIISFKIERFKKNKDLKTFEEILAYMDNKEIPYTDEDSRKRKIIFQEVSFILAIFMIVIILWLLWKSVL
ncbi:helix-turn-helix domain-containing protein [Romboutsia weinsteinii]|uniref:Helix-turn-helix domain-containing protein n=1 Tax=Romboutsia weinsteinii TaxID=2020949 RepID=A0A371IYB6_9FIRM|nr:helix-turn-helix domain-containing protein [Romboutsia weinsteinii]RDY25481.1 helix-turn-helix domain-containing protein [Romboutsia weinsteinii]